MPDLISRPALLTSLATARSHLMEGEDMVGRMYGAQLFREVERIVMDIPPQTYPYDDDRSESGLLEEE